MSNGMSSLESNLYGSTAGVKVEGCGVVNMYHAEAGLERVKMVDDCTAAVVIVVETLLYLLAVPQNLVVVEVGKLKKIANSCT